MTTGKGPELGYFHVCLPNISIMDAKIPKDPVVMLDFLKEGSWSQFLPGGQRPSEKLVSTLSASVSFRELSSDKDAHRSQFSAWGWGEALRRALGLTSSQQALGFQP